MASELEQKTDVNHTRPVDDDDDDEEIPPPPPPQQSNLVSPPSSTASPSPSPSSSCSSPPSLSPNANPSGPSVLILGGCGFIGRHLVEYLTRRKLVSHITVVDKSLVATSNMNTVHKALYEDKSLIRFKQADLSKDVHVERVFQNESYDYVFNLCGETRFGLTDKDYQIKCVETAAKCARAAAKIGVKKFIEVSTAQVYKPDKSPSVESSPVKPWTLQSMKRYEAEQIIQKVDGLPTVILRPAIVYGIGDLTGLTPRFSCASVYQSLGEKMRFLWGDELRLNVVHVDDVAAAMWIAAVEAKPGSIYNLADQQDLTQGTLNKWIASIFKIEVSCMGSIVSALAKLNLSGVAEEANDKHVPGFTELCHKHRVLNTPISPYIDKELLRDNHLSVDGRRIMNETSFKYERQISLELAREQIDSFIQQGVFPHII